MSSSLRKLVLNTVRDNAGKDFFESWAKNADGMDIIRVWLKAAATKKEVNGKREPDESLMPLLNVRVITKKRDILKQEWNQNPNALRNIQVIDRLPLGIDELRAAKIGRLVKGIVTDPPSSGECFYFDHQSRIVSLQSVHKQTGPPTAP